MFANELGWTSLELGPTDWLSRPLVAAMLVHQFSLAWPKTKDELHETVHLEKQKLHEIDHTYLCNEGILALLTFPPTKVMHFYSSHAWEIKYPLFKKKMNSFFIYKRYIMTNNKTRQWAT